MTNEEKIAAYDAQQIQLKIAGLEKDLRSSKEYGIFELQRADRFETELVVMREDLDRANKQSADRLIGLCKCGEERAALGAMILKKDEALRKLKGSQLNHGERIISDALALTPPDLVDCVVLPRADVINMPSMGDHVLVKRAEWDQLQAAVIRLRDAHLESLAGD